MSMVSAKEEEQKRGISLTNRWSTEAARKVKKSSSPTYLLTMPTPPRPRMSFLVWDAPGYRTTPYLLLQKNQKKYGSKCERRNHKTRGSWGPELVRGGCRGKMIKGVRLFLWGKDTGQSRRSLVSQTRFKMKYVLGDIETQYLHKYI